MIYRYVFTLDGKSDIGIYSASLTLEVPVNMTKHAIERSLRRGIPMDVVSAIYSYGTPTHSRGALALRLDRKAIELAQDDLPANIGRKLSRYRGAYIIADTATAITVARSLRRYRN